MSFELTNTTSGVATSVSVSSGNNQSAKVSEQFLLPLAVNVLDSYGAPVGDAELTFTVVPTNGAGASFVGGGTVATAETTGTGTATSPLLVAGSTAGSFSVQVSVDGVNKLAVFTLTALASAPYAISPVRGTSQEAQLGADFAVPLAVTVTDGSSNPVAGAQVTFSAPTSGASGVFAGHGQSVAVSTSSKGVAVAPSFSAELSDRWLHSHSPRSGTGERGHLRHGQHGPDWGQAPLEWQGTTGWPRPMGRWWRRGWQPVTAL